jgi:hypothetical protein
LHGKLANVPEGSANKWLLKESKWFNVSYSLAEEKMKNVFFGYKNNTYNDKAELLRQENTSKFNLQKMDERLWQILEQYVPSFSIENKFVLPKLQLSTQLSHPLTDANVSEIKLPKLKLI